MISCKKLRLKLKPEIHSSDNSVTWINSLGHALIEEVEISIGGQLIDKHYGEWLEIWFLTLDNSNKIFLNIWLVILETQDLRTKLYIFLYNFGFAVI